MPIYEYRCESCGQTIERLQKLSDPPLTVCPACEGTLKKLISAPAFQFKGSGWYVTDYADKGGKSASEGKNDGSSEGSSSGGDKDSSSSKASDGKGKDSSTSSESTSAKSSTSTSTSTATSSDKSKAS